MIYPNHWKGVNPYQENAKGKFIYDQATRYAIRIHNNDVAAPTIIKKMAERHLKDLSRSTKPRSGIKYEPWQITRFALYCKMHCVVPDRLKAKYVPLELLDPFALAYGMLLGWKIDNPTMDVKIDPLERLHGSCRYRHLFLETPKGSGKTPVAAAYILYHMIGETTPPTPEGEQGEDPPTVFIGVDQFEQSEVIKGYMNDMITQPLFSQARRDLVFKNKIYYCYTTKGNCIIKSATNKGAGTSGFAPSLIVIEEAQDHKSLALRDNLQMGTKNRIQAQTIYNLNAGSKYVSPIWSERTKAERIALGISEQDDYLPMIWGVDKKDEPLDDQECWGKAYPTLDITIERSYILGRVQAAKTSARERSEVLRLNFGIWAQNVSEDWLDYSVIEKQFKKKRPKRTDWNQLPMTIGLDLSRGSSLTGFCKVWLLPNGEMWVEADGYTCSAGLTEIKQKAEDLNIDEWIANKRGLRMADTATGERIDLAPIAARVFKLSQKYNLQAVGIDSFGKDQFYDALHVHTDDYRRDVKGRNVPLILGGLSFIEHPNTTFRKDLVLPGGLKEELYIHDTLERLGTRIADNKIFFLKNPAMCWNFGCVQVERKGESLRMAKTDAAESLGGRMDIFAAIVYGFGVMDKAIYSQRKNESDPEEEREAMRKLAKAMGWTDDDDDEDE